MAPRSVVIGATQVPFQHGGAEWHAEALLRQLKARGFLAELVQLPFQWDPREAALRSALAWRLLDFHQAGGQPIDLFVGTRFPSYAARHPNKVVWLFHQFRQAYDLHEAGLDGFPDTPEGRALREHVIALDTQALRECRRIFTTSRNNAARLRRFNGLDAELLPLPLEQPQAFACAEPEPFVLSVGRLVSLKRVDLLLRAVALLPPPCEARIVGDGPERPALEALARELGLGQRARFLGRLPDADVRDLYARAGAVFYAPWDEDYGLVTLEAFQSGRALVTTTDAGGPLEFVTDGATGLVTEPQPEALAAALRRLLENPALARRLGAAARESIAGLSWDAVIEALAGGAP